MRYALIIISLLILVAVGVSSWTPKEVAIHHPNTDKPAGPIYYQTVPVEFIEFEPLHINVHIAELQLRRARRQDRAELN